MGKWVIAGILIVVLLIVCAGIATLGYFAYHAARYGNASLAGFPGVSAEADSEKRFKVSGAATLSVENACGEVAITVGEPDKIIISAHKVAFGSSSDAAQNELKAMKVDVSQNGNEISVKFKRDASFAQNANNRVDFNITVPKETRVTADTGSGDITLHGTQGRAELESDFGNVSASLVSGDLKLSSSNGKVNATDIAAGGGIVDLSSSFGAISLRKAMAGEVKVSTSNGFVELDNVEAERDIKLNSSYGNVDYEIGRADRLMVETNNGKVTLENLTIKSVVSAKSDYGSVDLYQVIAGAYDVESNNGPVFIDGAGGNVKGHSDYGNVEVIHGKNATIDLTSNNGATKYTGSLGDGPHVLSSSYGSIELTIPSDTALSIDLKTDYGKVKSDLPVTLSGDLDNSHWVGTINRGGAKLTVTTGNGDIRINALNVIEVEKSK